MARDLVLLSGNEAIAEGSIAAGCRYYYSYPITPQNEIVEYMAKRLVEVGGVFLQAESELAAINMVYGTAACGKRVMTSSSSPGISLMQEGISYICAAELPCVVVNIQRGGPGLGNIAPSQADYFQATKGGGHGDYHCLVLAPYSCQEAYYLSRLSFELADKYRNPVMILGDAVIGQMIEPVDIGVGEDIDKVVTDKRSWAVGFKKNRDQRVIKTLYLVPEELEERNLVLQEKYRLMEEREIRYEIYNRDADIFLIAYGICSRVCLSVIEAAKKENINIGLFRPITLYPFPHTVLREELSQKEKILVVEMSYGQLLEDVRLAFADKNSKVDIEFYGRAGGVWITPDEILSRIKEIL